MLGLDSAKITKYCLIHAVKLNLSIGFTVDACSDKLNGYILF